MDIRAFYEPHTGKVALYITEERNGKRRMVTNMTLEDVTDGLLMPPSLYIDKSGLQHLPNDLDACGLLPSSLTAQRGELAATKYHLEDMRLIARMKSR